MTQGAPSFAQRLTNISGANDGYFNAVLRR
jgi:hypothetical protein